MRAFNINDSIKVKLTAVGIKAHRKYHVDLWHRLKCPHDFPYIPPKVDEDGFSSFQLWVFMEIFGPELGMLKPCLIEGNDIYFPGNE